MKTIVYGTKTCPWCAKTRNFLKENRVKFKDVDVGESTKSANEMIKKSGQNEVPVIEIDGKIIIGYDENKLKNLLKIRG